MERGWKGSWRSAVKGKDRGLGGRVALKAVREKEDCEGEEGKWREQWERSGRRR